MSSTSVLRGTDVSSGGRSLGVETGEEGSVHIFFTVTYIHNFSEFTYTHREIQKSSELFNIFTFCERENVIDIILNQGNTNDLVKLPRFGPRALAHLKGALNFENFTY